MRDIERRQLIDYGSPFGMRVIKVSGVPVLFFFRHEVFAGEIPKPLLHGGDGSPQLPVYGFGFKGLMLAEKKEYLKLLNRVDATRNKGFDLIIDRTGCHSNSLDTEKLRHQ